MIKVAIIGTQGVPAKYGGFESLAENLIGEYKSEDLRYTVFCSSKDCTERVETYKGAVTEYVGFRSNGAQSIVYDIVSMIRCLGRGFDVVLILGVSGCIFLPVFALFFRKRIIVNIDGLEHRRAKWNAFARWYLRLSEKIAVRFSDIVVSDNEAIRRYVVETYSRDAELITYGGDHALCEVDEREAERILSEYSLRPAHYALSVCRIEPENNCHLTLDSFARTGRELVFIGNWDRSDYGRKLKAAYSAFPNIHILNPIYDIPRLSVIRSNACLYIHGHSAGGTNPSLVEAMFFGIPILAFDVPYNRFTTFSQAAYWKDADELSALLSGDAFPDGTVMRRLSEQNYRWSRIVSQYEKLYR